MFLKHGISALENLELLLHSISQKKMCTLSKKELKIRHQNVGTPKSPKSPMPPKKTGRYTSSDSRLLYFEKL
jgi:hypothetical protein